MPGAAFTADFRNGLATEETNIGNPRKAGGPVCPGPGVLGDRRQEVKRRSSGPGTLDNRCGGEEKTAATGWIERSLGSETGALRYNAGNARMETENAWTIYDEGG